MASKKPKSKPKTPAKPTTLQNLAARPPGDETIDEQLVDASGVFRVTSAISQAQGASRDETTSLRFASDSLVMQAQKDGFREDGPTIDEAVEETLIDDETVRAEKRQRLATLAARAQQRRRR